MSPLYEKYRTRTLCNAPVFEANKGLARRLHDVPGHIVECGTWKGGMIAAIAEVLGDRSYVLLDSFQGLPPAQPVDGPAAIAWQAGSPDNCRCSAEDAHESMRMAGKGTWTLHEGWFADTLGDVVDEPIALLRLDADWYEATMLCLNTLFDRVTPGGIIIVDDYYVWDGCAKAVHEFLGNPDHRRNERIHEHYDVAYMVKL